MLAMAGEGPAPLVISALQHYAFCPRQFALIHVEQAWEDNWFTAEGAILHARVDSGVSEQRQEFRYERGVMLRSEKLGLTGKMDLLEIVSGEPPLFIPVEYKRGKPKQEAWDRIQLCAQAFCIEEMRNVSVNVGAIWYWEVRKREIVGINAELREKTLCAIRAARKILASRVTPAPTSEKNRCKSCSLSELCQPDTFRTDRSKQYIDSLYAD